MLSKNHIERLNKQGIEISENDGCFSITISSNLITESLYANIFDIPIELKIKSDNTFQLIRWEFIPGSGPGDFNLIFDTELDIVKFLESYYFGINIYSEASKKHYLQSRSSINVNEIKKILNSVLKTLENQFHSSEIFFGERGIFNKIPMNSWRITECKEEKNLTETDTGFLENEVYQLRNKTDKNEEFNFQDINNVSDLLFELSLIIKENTQKSL